MPFPLIPLLITMAASQGASSIAGSVANRRAQRDQNAQSDKQQLRDLSFSESQQNPYREQLAQGRSLGKLGLMKGSSYTPYHLGGGSYLDGAQPSGGYSFEDDPRTSMANEALYDSVLRGETPARSWMSRADSLDPTAGTSPNSLPPGRGGPATLPTRRAAPRPDYTQGGQNLLPLLMSMYGGGR